MRNNGRLFKSFLTTYSWVFVLIAGSYLFRTEPGFYEGGIYIDYLTSFLQDHDFNIINHVPDAMAWMSTPSGFHPDFHSLIQTPFLLLLYGIDRLAFLPFDSAGDITFHYSLISISLTMLSLWTGYKILTKLAQETDLKYETKDFFLFWLGTAAIYFTFFQSTVIEVTLFPIVAFLVLNLIRLNKTNALSDPFISGCAIGLLICTKVSFLLIAIPVLLKTVRLSVKNKKWPALALHFTPILLLVTADSVNISLKYGTLMNPVVQTSKLFFNGNLPEAIIKLWTGLFLNPGLFYINPIYFLSLLGFFILIYSWLKKGLLSPLDSLIILIFVVGGFAFPMFAVGDLFEDHLPGRLILVAAPLFLLGLLNFRNLIPRKYITTYNITLVAAVLWFQRFNIYSMVIADTNSYLFPRQIVPDTKMWSNFLSNYEFNLLRKFDVFSAHAAGTSLFVILISMIFILSLRPSNNKWRLLVAAIVPSLLLMMTVANLSLSPEKIRSLRSQGFYENKVIGNGAEIYFFDYVFDNISFMRGSGDPTINSRLNSIRDRYFEIIQNQLIKSTPEFDHVLRAKSEDYSFWNRMEIESRH